jgi:hypothetical protein
MNGSLEAFLGLPMLLGLALPLIDGIIFKVVA